jgi:hypothetical protein
MKFFFLQTLEVSVGVHDRRRKETERRLVKVLQVILVRETKYLFYIFFFSFSIHLMIIDIY